MATQVGSGPPASARPTGTVTFLFSDIEGSTVRWESAPEAMAPALERHDALVRATIEAHNGYVFKTIGDAFCASFASAQEAMAAALDAQRALATEDFSMVDGLRVRMALHSGSADARGGDYFGPTVNRVARLLAIGHGGQVLISGACTELLQGEMQPNCSLRDLGAHRLKDLAHPEQVYQLIAPDLPETFPALLSLNYLSNNLPAQLTSFVGREGVVAEIKTLLEHHRLVTLVGSGGAGKTRCAIQVGAELVDGSGNGVWLAELAPISDPSLLASVIARALSVQESPNRPIVDTLVAYLKRKRLLLILDNCEHVIDEARAVVGSVLRNCPDVRILATSREGLKITGEQLYRMPSLSVPPASKTLSAQDMVSFGGMLLFADRAFSVDGHFALTDENVPHVAEICRRLDGIPLAIELAAARVKVLSPKHLAQKLDERFRVLTGGDRSALPRHQTMRALIDWSYDLLSDDERSLFRRLSIFAGGFTIETASVVCSAEEIDEIEMLDRVSSLVDKSLVQAEVAGSGMRYRLLESTRQYAREKLIESGAYEAVARAHAAAYLALAEELEDAWETTPDRAWYALAEPELENFRAALGWALGARGEVLIGQQLVGTLRTVWSYFGTAEGQRWVQSAQELADAQTPAAALAALDLAEAHLTTGLVRHKASLLAAQRALERYRELGDPLRTARAQQDVGSALVFVGSIAQGEAVLTQALAEARTLGASRLTSSVLENLAFARNAAGDLAGARQLYAEALAMARSIGAERVAAVGTASLAEAEFRGGDAAAALQLAGEALAVFRASNDTRAAANALCNMAAYLVKLGRYDEARTSAREGLAAARETQVAVYVAFALQHLAAVGAMRSNTETPSREEHTRAARVLGYVDARLAALEALREYTEQQEYDTMLPALRDALGADECAKLMAEGSTWSEDQAVAHLEAGVEN
jgi:predicted ATPase/class 3 adenylate cyclase